ncbi:MAG: SRPBCC family protein [Actinomycetota bacterium]
MRYADGPTVEVETQIHAAPARVWELVSDINLPARFSSEFLGAEWLDGATRAELGARFAGRNQHAAIGEWATTSFVVACDPEHSLEWAVTDPDQPAASWRFEIEPAGSGTRLKQWMRMGPGRSGLNIAIDAMPDKEERIIERRLAEHRANMTATLAGIKAMAEEGDG